VIRVELPYPDKALWPNGRAHFRTKAKAVKNHRAWADLAALQAVQIAQISTACSLYSGAEVDSDQTPIRVHMLVYPKPRGPLPDKDNCVAAAKSYLDGIAQRLGINDRLFAAPTVEFDSLRNGRFVIEIGSPS
jgi:hypothetical protein